MAPPRPWTVSEVATVERLREDGVPVRAIAAQLGRSRDSVTALIQRQDMTRPVWWTSPQAHEAHAMYMRGVKLKVIGERLGRSSEAVKAMLWRQGRIPRVSWKPMTMAEREHILELNALGFTMYRIAKIVGRHRNTVRALLRERLQVASLPMS
jgi:IS30 family transposase